MRYMKIVMFAALGLLMSSKSFAEDWSFSGGFGFKYQTVDFAVANTEFKPLFVSNTLNIAASRDRIYINFEHDISVKDHQELEFGPNEILFIGMGRSDTNLTFGYLLNDSASIFMGYKQATLDVKLNSVIEPSGGAPVPTPPPYVGNQPRAQDVEFSDKGLYVGASYTHNVGETGALSYSVAYADLDGEVSIMSAEYDVTTNTILRNFTKIDGSTSGISWGIVWTDGFAENVAYNIALKMNLYEFDDEVLLGGNDLSTEETFTILSIGLRKYF